MAGAVVEGYADLQRALKRAEKDVRLGWRKELRAVAEPVAARAKVNAVAQIRGIREGDPWAEMRVGVTQKGVYVAPRQRGRKRGSPPPSDRRRKADQDFADMLMARAMEPALFTHGPQVIHELEQVLDRMADRFNRGV